MKPYSEIRSGAGYSFVTISELEYVDVYQPLLQAAINLILTMKPEEFTSLSFEKIYSAVYKCVCSQFSERLFMDLKDCIRDYLHKMVNSIREVQLTEFIQYFSDCLNHYRRSLEQLLHVFSYLNRYYVETKLMSNFHDLLLSEFTVIVAEPYIKRIIDLLGAAKSRPFTIAPDTMAGIVTGLYLLKPEYAEMDPLLFAAYIPNILPPMCEADIPKHALEIRCFQQQMIREGYTRRAGPLKRPLESDSQNEASNHCDRKLFTNIIEQQMETSSLNPH